MGKRGETGGGRSSDLWKKFGPFRIQSPSSTPTSIRPPHQICFSPATAISAARRFYLWLRYYHFLISRSERTYLLLNYLVEQRSPVGGVACWKSEIFARCARNVAKPASPATYLCYEPGSARYLYAHTLAASRATCNCSGWDILKDATLPIPP